MDKHFRAENLGIVPRAINYLFRQLQERSVATSSPYYIRVSYCEIYNEQVRYSTKELHCARVSFHLDP